MGGGRQKFSSGSFNLIKVMNITFSKGLNVIRDFFPFLLAMLPCEREPNKVEIVSFNIASDEN